MSDAGLRVGVYVAENLSRNGGERMQYRVLRNIACREGGQAIRLNTSIAFDARRGRHRLSRVDARVLLGRPRRSQPAGV